MPNIQNLYNYLKDQTDAGMVILERTGKYGIPGLLTQLNLDTISLSDPMLSAMGMGYFTLTGIFTENGREYTCLFKVSERQDDCDYMLQAKMILPDALPLNDLYPPAFARAAYNFYSEPIDLFTGTMVSEAVITADTANDSETAQLQLSVYFEEQCPVYQQYQSFVPNPGETVELRGTVENPFGQSRYSLTAGFIKEIWLPFYTGDTMAREALLELNSHVPDVYEYKKEKLPSYMCELRLKLLIPIDAIPEEQVWLTVNLLDSGNQFYAYVDFGQGLTITDLLSLIVSLTGKSELPDLSGWSSLNNVSLLKLVMKMEKGISADSKGQGNGSFIGCAFHIALDLPDLPIPFFEKDAGGAQLRLLIQWDMLDIGGGLTVITGFYAVWKTYHITVNIELPDLYFQGIYERQMDETPVVSSIFPGFMDLYVKYIRLAGYLPDQTYELDFELENNSLRTIPIGNHLFQIDYIAGNASYSPTGLVLGITLEFTLFTAIFQLSGTYDQKDGQKLLTLEGGLRKPFLLSDLIALITGQENSESSLEFKISTLSLRYVTQLSETERSTLGTPVSFLFLCGIEFDWGGDNAVKSTFHLEWEQEKYTFSISAGIYLLEYFLFEASCLVEINKGDTQFKEFLFRTKIKNTEITATYKENKNLFFQVRNFNLGELIEGLINIIAPDHNWYLPWPFHVLKQITLSKLDVTIDREKETIQARYDIQLKILFLEVEYIELFYDYKAGDFLVNVKVNASIGNRNSSVIGEAGDDIYDLNLLKDQFRAVKDLGSQMFDLKYLGIGQHIQVEIPPDFDETAFSSVLESLKQTIKKSGRPALNPDNNWVTALEMNLIKAVDITLLMCDPGFYGLEVKIGKGSELLDQLTGLKFVVLYSKVTDTIGLFYARLTLPEVFRVIELGAVQLQLGEIAVSIYTNGNFKIDMGFPYNKDFSRSFGLTYLIFSGKGGFYFGLLNGDTSRCVPAVNRGHFEGVVELGIGIMAGVGREISLGPLKAGAYVMLVALFEGVLANYISDREGAESSLYYKIHACAGVTASIYGSVDFVLIQIGFSVNASFMTDLVLERYQPAVLGVQLSISVDAYIKILFIKISFSFRFTWKDSFILGSSSTPPWENQFLAVNEASVHYRMEWLDRAVFPDKKTVCAEIVPYFTYDQPEFAKKCSGQPKVTFLSMLHGMDDGTRRTLGYEKEKDTPFSILMEGLFLRAVSSVKIEMEEATYVTKELLEFLMNYLSDTASFSEGFSSDHLDSFLDCNIDIYYLKSDGIQDSVIEGIPFPLTPYTQLTWFSAPDSTKTYDLTAEPLVGEDFLDTMAQYYHQLSVWNEMPKKAYRTNRQESASAFIFRQYFYMLTKLAVSIAMDEIGDRQMELADAVKLVTGQEALQKAAGMVSRFSYGGNRIYTEKLGTQSLYTFACQQFNCLPIEGFGETDIIHQMTVRFQAQGSRWAKMACRMVGPDQAFMCNGLRMLQDTASEELVWTFTKQKLTYPQGALRFTNEPVLLPFYRYQTRVIGLKNPQWLMEDTNIVFLEAQSGLPERLTIALENPELQKADAEFERGFLLFVPLKAYGGDLFEIEPLGYENILKLRQILKDTVINLEAYRYTNVLDIENCGFSRLGDEIFLYRSNLSLEAEKPELFHRREHDIGQYTNTAYLTEPGQFLQLLSDACLINARGYFTRFHLEHKHVLQDGRMTMVLWVGTEKAADAVKLLTSYEPDRQNPVAVTEETIGIYAYEPGTLAFSLKAEEALNSLQENYQMLGYQVRGNQYFRESHESRPVFAQNTDQMNQYSQVVPAFLFAEGDEDNPYKGIVENSSLELEYSLIDILGNQSKDKVVKQIPYGYSDPLLSPTSYPHTKCVFRFVEQDQGIVLDITFSYIEEEGGSAEKAADYLRLAYWQLCCEDVKLYASLDAEIELDLKPLREYVRALYTEVIPESVSYQIPFDIPEAEKKLEINLSLKRNAKLLAAELKGSPEAAAILEVKAPVREDQDSTGLHFIARKGSDGSLFYVPPRKPAFTISGIWTLPPLSNKLLNLNEITVKNPDGTEGIVSYHDVDLDVWADYFLSDLELLISPSSVYASDREMLEALLEIKKQLARIIAQGITVIAEGGSANSQAAADYYENLMLQNLYTGRNNDAVLLLQSDKKPAPATAWLFRAGGQSEGVTIKPGKMKEEGILPIGLDTNDVSKHMQIDCLAELTMTDVEIEGKEEYDYLTLQKSEAVLQRITASLPYKRFPDMPKLVLHKFGSNHDELQIMKWNYETEFSHDTAEQDMITLRLIFGEEGVAAAKNSRSLGEALAQYIYLRDTFQTDSGTKELLLEVCRDVSETWSYGQEERSLKANRELQLKYSVNIQDKRLHLLYSDIVQEQLDIRMLTEEGEYLLLEPDQGMSYRLPDVKLTEPYSYIFDFRGFDIRTENIINTCISVTRNQSIKGINEKFIYRSGEAFFQDSLQPSVHLDDAISMGIFSQDNFKLKSQELFNGFGHATMEIYCKVPLPIRGDEQLFTYLPIIYVPEIEDTDSDERFVQIYDKVIQWVSRNIDNNLEGVNVSIYLSLYDKADKKRNLVELSAVEFKMQLQR